MSIWTLSIYLRNSSRKLLVGFELAVNGGRVETWLFAEQFCVRGYMLFMYCKWCTPAAATVATYAAT